jgi:acyl carrier protein
VDEAVITILSEVLQIPRERITDELAMRDTEFWDSLKHMELIGSLEQQFNLQLSFEEIVTMRSVSEIKRVLRQKTAEN